MLKRDFTKSNKEFFKQYKNILISIAVFLVVGILVFSIFGMNGNFEIKGYNEFTVTVTEEMADDYVDYQRKISNIVNSYDGKFDTMTIYGKGDDTKFVVRYCNDVKENEILEINKLVAEDLKVNISAVSNHIEVGAVADKTDYLYTATSILLIILIATIFAYIRYNGASAMAVLISNLLGLTGFMSIGAILRLQIGMSYFAMLVVLTLLITYLAINLFESMHKSSWLVSSDYATAIQTAVNQSKFRTCVLGVGVLAIGLIFVLMAPSAIKYISLNIMFMAVVVLAVSLYVIPFVWSIFITRCRKREYKVKANATSNKK